MRTRPLPPTVQWSWRCETPLSCLHLSVHIVNFCPPEMIFHHIVCLPLAKTFGSVSDDLSRHPFPYPRLVSRAQTIPFPRRLLHFSPPPPSVGCTPSPFLNPPPADFCFFQPARSSYSLTERLRSPFPRPSRASCAQTPPDQVHSPPRIANMTLS